MNYRKIALLSLFLLIFTVGFGVVSAQEATDETAVAVETQPQPPQPPDGNPPGNPPSQPPEGTPPSEPPGNPPSQPPDGVPPMPRPVPQWQYSQSSTTTETSTVYPAQVVILRHIEQTIADALGLTRAVVNDLRLSMTFDEVVALYDGDVSAVRNQATIDLIAWVSEGLNDGTISQARGTIIINNLSEIVERAFTGAFNVNGTTVTGLLGS
jgi:hypothetical protein